MTTQRYTYNLRTLFNNDDISYYLLGAFMSDGWITPAGKNSFRSHIGSKDKEWIENIKNLFDPNIKLYVRNDFYTLSINNKKISEWFLSNECIMNKTLIVKLPTIPERYYPDFIRGVFDGDGSLTIYETKTRKAKHFSSFICGSSIELLTGIQTILTKNNIYSHIREIHKKDHLYNGKSISQKHQHWQLQLSKTQTIKFLTYIYYDGHRLSLRRKLDKFEQMKSIYAQEKMTNNRLNTKCKIRWPSNEKLIELVKSYSYVEVSKMLGVSGAAIVSRMKTRNIYIPRYNLQITQRDTASPVSNDESVGLICVSGLLPL